MNNKIKMIITDLDKSLLNSNYEISDYTANIFMKCKENGIIIVFATARPYRNTKIFFNKIIPNVVICHSGAIIYENDKEIFQCGINKNITEELLLNISTNYPDVEIGIENNDKIYANFDPSKYWPENKSYISLDINNLPEKDMDKIIVKAISVEKTKEIKNYLHKQLYFYLGYPDMANIMNKNATKWNAIKILLDKYNIEVKNTIAFGDDSNDIEMIEKCGIGVAVENGIDEIKCKAKYICGKNSDDGIANWIEEYLGENYEIRI